MLDEPLTSDESAAGPQPDLREDPQRRLSREEVTWLTHGATSAPSLGVVSDADTYSATPEHGSVPNRTARRIFQLPELRPGTSKRRAAGHAQETDMRIELARRPISAEEADGLAPGQVVSLEDASHLVSLYAGDRFIATGELLIQDECLCVRVVELPGDAFLGVSARIF